MYIFTEYSNIMKKVVIFLALLLIVVQISKAQIVSKKMLDFPLPDKETNLVNKGDNFVNVYYGPNLLTFIYKRLLVANGTSNLRINSVGPLGIVYEHLLTDNIGLGAELGYTDVILKYDYESTIINGTKTISTEKLDIITYRLAFRANFHFAKSDKLDAYGFVSAGYRGTSLRYTSSVPGGSASYNSPSFIPFGIKPGIGLRYFFTPAFGLNAEFAIGTPLICGGLSFKFK